MKIKLVACLILIALLQACSRKSDAEKTAEYFDSIRNDSVRLMEFFEQMPKGAELHHHAIGSNFAENLIDIAVDKRPLQMRVFIIAGWPL